MTTRVGSLGYVPVESGRKRACEDISGLEMAIVVDGIRKHDMNSINSVHLICSIFVQNLYAIAIYTKN